MRYFTNKIKQCSCVGKRDFPVFHTFVFKFSRESSTRLFHCYLISRRCAAVFRQLITENSKDHFPEIELNIDFQPNFPNWLITL